MRKSEPTSRVFKAFRELERSDHRSVIRFVENYQREIRNLEFEEYFELQLNYAYALFEIGDSHRFLRCVDKLLEESIQHNVKYYYNEDIFAKLLFKKGACHYRMRQWKKAQHVFSELLKMYPSDSLYQTMLQKSWIQDRPTFVYRFTGVGILMLFIALACLSIYLITYSLLENTAGQMLLQYFWKGTILAAFTLSFTGEGWHRVKCWWKTRQIIQNAENKTLL